jgi:hypothetical protein
MSHSVNESRGFRALLLIILSLGIAPAAVAAPLDVKQEFELIMNGGSVNRLVLLESGEVRFVTDFRACESQQMTLTHSGRFSSMEVVNKQIFITSAQNGAKYALQIKPVATSWLGSFLNNKSARPQAELELVSAEEATSVKASPCDFYLLSDTQLGEVMDVTSKSGVTEVLAQRHQRQHSFFNHYDSCRTSSTRWRLSDDMIAASTYSEPPLRQQNGRSYDRLSGKPL